MINKKHDLRNMISGTSLKSGFVLMGSRKALIMENGRTVQILQCLLL